jgi:hypothetical protein
MFEEGRITREYPGYLIEWIAIVVLAG